MIYQAVTADAPLSQGDIIDRCQILVWDEPTDADDSFEPVEVEARVIVLTQACDLAQTRGDRAVVAVVHSAESLVSQGILKAGRSLTRCACIAFMDGISCRQDRFLNRSLTFGTSIRCLVGCLNA